MSAGAFEPPHSEPRLDERYGAGLTKIAIVKLSSLGDVIHALPVARAIRRARPGIHLALDRGGARVRPAAGPSGPRHGRAGGHAALAAAHPAPVGRARGAGQGRPAARPHPRGRFDVALDLQGLIKSGLLTAYTGAPLRIGFTADHCREGLNCLFTNRRVRPPAEAVHVVDQYLALLGPLGIPAGPVEFHVPIPARATLAHGRLPR